MKKNDEQSEKSDKKSRLVMEKIQKFVEEEGIMKQHLAKKLGVTPEYFYQVIHRRSRLNPQYWKKLMEITKGYVTLYDLVHDYFDGEETIKVEPYKDEHSCIVSLN